MVRRRSDCRKGPSGGAQTRKENEHEKDAIRAIEDGYEKYAMEEHDRSMSLLSVMMQVRLGIEFQMSCARSKLCRSSSQPVLQV